MTKEEEMDQANKLENDFHKTDRPPPIQTFANQNARAKVRLELDNGVLMEVPISVIMRALQAQWANKMEKTGRHCFGVPLNSVSEPEMLFLILTTTPPEGWPKSSVEKVSEAVADVLQKGDQ